MKTIKVWSTTDYKKTEEYHPITWDDLLMKSKLLVTIMTLKQARTDDPHAHVKPHLKNVKDGCWEMIVKVKELKEKDLQKYLNVLTLFTGFKYQYVKNNLWR